MRFRRRRSRDTDVELNITAFLNLMVVLIPFLLINAVFAQVSILQLNLPAVNDSSTPSEDDEKDKLVLEVLIYGNRYEVVDRNTSAVLKIVDNQGDKHDSKALHDYLVTLKENFPEETAITLLGEDPHHGRSASLQHADQWPDHQERAVPEYQHWLGPPGSDCGSGR